MNKIISNKIKRLSFLLSICVIMIHTNNLNVYKISNGFLYWFEKYISSISNLAVPVFFSLSAFLFYRNLCKDNIKRKLISRIKTLIIPYVLWNVIGYLYFHLLALFPGIAQNYSGSISLFSLYDLLKSIVNADYNLVTWFLRYLIVYTYVLPFFYPIFNNKKISIVILMLCSFFGLRFDSLLFKYLQFYILGIVAAKHYKDFVYKDFNKRSTLISLIVFLLINVITTYLLTKTNITFYDLDPLRLFEIPIVWILTNLLPTTDIKHKIFDISFLSFVMHEMILEPIEKIIYITLPHTVFIAFVDYILAPLLTVYMIYLISIVLKKTPTISKVLTGNR